MWPLLKIAWTIVSTRALHDAHCHATCVRWEGASYDYEPTTGRCVVFTPRLAGAFVCDVE